MTTATETTTLTYRLHIKASQQEVWDALTTRGEEYGYRSRAEYDLRPGGAYKGFATAEMREYGMPELAVDGEVLEVDAPKRLVHTWHANFDEKIGAEAPATLTWELEEWPGGTTRLTLTADYEGAPIAQGITSGDVAEAMGGFPFVLSDLKTLLETGRPLSD